MKDYTCDTPKFSDVLRIIETSDLVNAEVPNVALRQLFQNTLYNRQWIEQLESSTGDVGEYDAETAYKAGNYCSWQGFLYKCIQDTTGEWDPDCWMRTSAIEEINGVKSGLSELKEWFVKMFADWGRVITVVIPAAGWSSAAPYTNRVEIEGMHETDNVDVTFVPGEGATNAQNIAAWEGYVGINYSVTEDGAMVFHAFETKPAVDVTVAIKGMAQRAEPESPTEPEPEGPESLEMPGEPETSESPENQ